MKKAEKMPGNGTSAAELRCKAEQRLHEKHGQPTQELRESDVRALVHEIQVHQIQLEMQYEEVAIAQAAAEAVSRKYTELFDFAPTGYFLWDERGVIREVNLAGAALLQLDRNAAINKRFGQFVALEDRPAFADFCQRVLATDAKQTCEVKLLSDGSPVHVLVEGIAAQDRPGPVKLCRAAVIDITQQKRADELTAVNQALQSEIAAHQRAEEALAQAKVAAEAANQAKSEFLANMSHEIRTPMTSIMGYSELLLQPNIPEDERRRYLSTVRRNGQALLQIIDDILDLSKIEVGRMDVERLACSPWQVVEEACAVLRLRAEEKSLSLATDYRDPLPATIHTDPVRLRQILVNLVGNAIKFTERGGVRISVSMKTEGLGTGDWRLETRKQQGTGDGRGSGDRGVADPQSLIPNPQSASFNPPSPNALCFSVQDTGIGMSREGMQKIFQPFSQADTSHSRRFGGTGLGLTICQRLAKLLGGSITVESALGQGTTFTLALELDQEDQVGLVQCDPRRVPCDVSPSSTAAESFHGRVLLAEDAPDSQTLLRLILQKAGLEVDVADNGQTACVSVAASATQDRPYDLILMDVQMPVMNGLEATENLRRHGWEGRIVALTAHAMASDRQRCLAAGCDDYLAKPITRQSLFDTLRRYLKPGHA